MSVPQMSPAEAADVLDDRVAVDVREPYEFDGPLGHVPGSRCVPLAGVPEALEDLPRDARLLLVCRSGKRSQRACELLQEAGFDGVANLAGGMIAWNRDGLEVERPGFSSTRALAENLVAYLAQITGTEREHVRSSLEELLEDAGSTPETPSAAALEWALQELAEGARQPAPPADLDLVVAAYRRDLAVL